MKNEISARNWQGVANRSLGSQRIWKPVSYTHLDVYKRQDIDMWFFDPYNEEAWQ